MGGWEGCRQVCIWMQIRHKIWQVSPIVGHYLWIRPQIMFCTSCEFLWILTWASYLGSLKFPTFGTETHISGLLKKPQEQPTCGFDRHCFICFPGAYSAPWVRLTHPPTSGFSSRRAVTDQNSTWAHKQTTNSKLPQKWHHLNWDTWVFTCPILQQ